EPVVRRTVPVPVLVAQHQKLMGVVQLARANPVAAVLHPIADVQSWARGKQMPRGATRDRRRRAREEVKLGRPRAPRHVLHGGRRHGGVVVPTPPTKGGVFERFLKEESSRTAGNGDQAWLRRSADRVISLRARRYERGGHQANHYPA